MPSMMDVRNLGSIRVQSPSNHRLTASNWAALSAQGGVGWGRVLDGPGGSEHLRKIGGPLCPRARAGRIVMTGPGRERGREEVLAFVHDDPAVIGAEVSLSFFDAVAEFIRIDDVFVDLKERDVVVEHLVQQDHELDEMGARLLPERFLSATNRFVMSVAIP